jgi:hypothetical protein
MIVRMRRAALMLLFTTLCAQPALAQAPKPIPPFVIDVRGFFVGFGEDEVTARDLGIAVDALPTRGLGGALGLTLYPVRRDEFAIGLGGEAILARGRSQPVDSDGEPIGPQLERRLQSIAGQMSFNFGHRDGWSYLSAGLGPLRFETFAGSTAPAEAPPFQMTFNFGGGARWFTSRHLAVCFDLRFYETKPVASTLTSPGRERRRLFVLSAGVAFK